MKSILRRVLFLTAILILTATSKLLADDLRNVPLTLSASDVIPTGNEWIAMPVIRVSDAALMNFNVLSMRDRGLLQVEGDRGGPALQPYVAVNGKKILLSNLSWELLEYWIPIAHAKGDGFEVEITYCAPLGIRAFLVKVLVRNTGTVKLPVTAGVRTSWGSLQRVTYTPVELRGYRTEAMAAWEPFGRTFSFVTYDTHFAWSLDAPKAAIRSTAPPVSGAPALEAERVAVVNPGESLDAYFVVGAGLEEYSASQSAAALTEMIDRSGVDAIINQTAKWCRARTRTTGRGDLDQIMNRNLLFTALYAWGRAIDTEQLVGVTSRSPRYYVSAAYWDRDAMLWSFPGLLDIDKALAREALDYALTTQLRNTGVHSRFIDGMVLEDGYELDEGVAPLIALNEYVRQTGDMEFASQHWSAIKQLKHQLLTHFDSRIGLFSTLQDAQDQYRKQEFSTYDNVLVWKALKDYANLCQSLKQSAEAADALQRAEALRSKILQVSVSRSAPGARDSVFVSATDGEEPIFAEVPPGSLMKLPALDFIGEDDPTFVRTYDWLHSANYEFSFSDKQFGLPGSYRLPFTTSWAVADHLRLKRGREQALKVLLSSGWDGGIISEGVDPASGVMDYDGRAFATAAGYVGHAICEAYCKR
jgi:hypothetical protein